MSKAAPPPAPPSGAAAPSQPVGNLASVATVLTQPEREELIWRRISETVTDSVDKQIKRRYFWAALLFAGLSWFGGVGLISNVVESRVTRELKQYQQDLAEAKVVTTQARKDADEVRSNATNIMGRLGDAEKRETGLETTLARVQEATNAAIQQLQESVRKQGGVGEKPRILIRFGPGISQDVAQQVANKLRVDYYEVEYGSGPFVGSTSLRYFYKEDAPSQEMISKVNDALHETGITDKSILVVPLTDFPIKPPKGTLELWVNRSA